MKGTHRRVVTGLEWVTHRYGVETWVLRVCICGDPRHRKVEKIDGKWTLEQLGYRIEKIAAQREP